jgi:formylglycine-generating enzyme required for sulfatase activity/CheY-like chemotaxis protein
MVVLIVDGNAEIRGARAELLRSQGHQVAEAASAAEAVEWGNTHEALNLLITEVILEPETFGFDLKEGMQGKFEDLVTLFTTRFDLTGYEPDMDGATALPSTTSDADFLAHVLAAVGGPPEAVVRQPLLPPGTQLGFYQILERLYIERESETYLAFQTTVQRKVALVLLKPELHQNAGIVADFKERERIKAQISHPRIAPLYEGKDEHGYIYYTRELPPGRSLDELQSKGAHFTERVVTDVLYRVADAMAYASGRGLNYRPLGMRDIYVDEENQASIANIFRPATATPRDQPADVRALLDLVQPFASQGKARGLLSELYAETHTWATIAQKLDDIRSDMSERSLLRRAESEDLIAAVPKKKRWLYLGGALLACLAVAGLGGRIGNGLQPPKAVPLKQEMIVVDAGDYIVHKEVLVLVNDAPTRFKPGAKVDAKDQHVQLLAPFSISKYEVTISQYAAFLKVLKSAPPGAFDDPMQNLKAPSKNTHTPEDWEAYYPIALNGERFKDQSIDINCPVFGVDYWDAVAYAKWAKQRLPTELEWEIAARGAKGNSYPWGNQAAPLSANLGDDYVKNGKGGQRDNYNRWAPVNKPDGDKSAFGIMGMAGNVQEWTSTWAIHPERPDDRVPVIRGGDFTTASAPNLLNVSIFPDSSTEARTTLGFRTVDIVAGTGK